MAADVAQPVEQRFRKAWVACSSQVIGFGVEPRRSRSFRLWWGFFKSFSDALWELRSKHPPGNCGELPNSAAGEALGRE